LHFAFHDSHKRAVTSTNISNRLVVPINTNCDREKFYLTMLATTKILHCQSTHTDSPEYAIRQSPTSKPIKTRFPRQVPLAKNVSLRICGKQILIRTTSK